MVDLIGYSKVEFQLAGGSKYLEWLGLNTARNRPIFEILLILSLFLFIILRVWLNNTLCGNKRNLYYPPSIKPIDK